jgi:hypothetical protein
MKIRTAKPYPYLYRDLTGKVLSAGACGRRGARRSPSRARSEVRSSPQIMAISGHKSLSEIERYTKAADQKHMAERAIARTDSVGKGPKKSL